VIVFRNPRNESEFYIKRVIGLPGEEIIIKGNEIKINGKQFDEDYLVSDYGVAGEQVFNLGDDEYFVMGDNRIQSFDSRSWGALKKREIIGMVRLRFWPLEDAHIYEKAPDYNFS
jgi:signal peptidase I